MITSKRFNIILAVALIIALLLSGFLVAVNANSARGTVNYQYPEKLFSKGSVMSVNIIVDEDDWQDMLDNALSEQYIMCDVEINGTLFRDVGIRPKGNTSLSSIVNSDSDRYSFKVEFDHYIDSQTCWGLDKLVLNNVYQDNTYLKEYISYDLFSYMNVAAPLYTFAQIQVNGVDWGLYFGLEAVEKSFAIRNYGADYGELYKPDSEGIAFGAENQEDFANRVFEQFEDSTDAAEGSDATTGEGETVSSGANVLKLSAQSSGQSGTTPPTGGPGGTPPTGTPPDMQGGTPPDMPEGAAPPDMGDIPQDEAPTDSSEPDTSGDTTTPDATTPDTTTPDTSGDTQGATSGMTPPNMNGGGGRSMGGSGTDLSYTDDEVSSYTGIFNTAVFNRTNEEDNLRVVSALKGLSEGGEALADSVDVDANLRYIAVNSFLGNFDSYFGTMEHNYYLYEKDGKLTMLPWDYNLAFGGFSGSSSDVVNLPIDEPIYGSSMEDRPMISQLLAVDEYKQTYYGYLSEIVNDYFLSGRYEQTINEACELIDEYVKNDPTAFCTYEEYQSGVEALKLYGTLKAQSVSGQLDGTIPTTSAGQAEDSSALIDTTGLNLSDTGTFGGGMGGMGGGKPSGERSNDTQTNAPTDDSTTSAESPDIVTGATQATDGSSSTSPSTDGSNSTSPSTNGSAAADAPTPPTGNPGEGGGNEIFSLMETIGRENMQSVMSILGDATAETITQEQRDQLYEYGLTDEQIDSLLEMSSQFGGGFPGGNFQGGAMTPPDQSGNADGFTPMGGSSEAAAQVDTGGVLVLYGVSAAVLVLGLVFVILFKRRRYCK